LVKLFPSNGKLLNWTIEALRGRSSLPCGRIHPNSAEHSQKGERTESPQREEEEARAGS
jgi:hypothetical protein